MLYSSPLCPNRLLYPFGPIINESISSICSILIIINFLVIFCRKHVSVTIILNYCFRPYFLQGRIRYEKENYIIFLGICSQKEILSSPNLIKPKKQIMSSFSDLQQFLVTYRCFCILSLFNQPMGFDI